MKLVCSVTTLSGAFRLASSGQRRRGTALVTRTPMPPSPTIAGPLAKRSSKRLLMRAQPYWRVKWASQPLTRDRSTDPSGAILVVQRRSAPMRRGELVETHGPDAAGPVRCNCGSLTGDSGGAGRRPRLMYLDPAIATNL